MMEWSGEVRLQEQLFAMQDMKYREFHSRLLPGIDKETIIGIRTPVLRRFAGKFLKAGEFLKNTDFGDSFPEAFFRSLPHRYYEENNLHLMLVSQIGDYRTCVDEVERFLPYINNWATCDLPAPKCFAAHKEELMPKVRSWIASGQTYTVRYGIGMLMAFWLDEDFQEEYLALTASAACNEYYVNMMIAWYFATALAKQWDRTVIWLEECRLPEWVHRKTIQKAVESYRITLERKEYLKGLRSGSSKV